MAKVVVSNKSTKNEILEAYNELLNEVGATNDNDRVKNQKREEADLVVTKAKSNSASDIIHQIATLKINAGQALDELSKQLVIERDNLQNLEVAVSLEEKKLEDLHSIVANANSLEALLLAQKKKQEEFEKELSTKRDLFEVEMLEKKTSWTKEQEEYERLKKEKEEAYEKAVKRQKEEYEYQSKLQEQKDMDAYASKKISLERELMEKKAIAEKELQEREAIISSRGQELNELREASKNFAEELKLKVEDAKQVITKELESKYQFEKELYAKEVEGQALLYKQTIGSLEDKLKERQTVISEMNKQLNSAQLQAQELAKKVVEGAAQSRQFMISSDSKEEKKKE